MAAESATEAIYLALSSPEPDPRVVHAAIEEIRDLSGQNVIAVLGAKIDALGARIDAQSTRIDALSARIDAQIAEVKAEIKAQSERIDAQSERIDLLQRVIWRVIWPLVALVAAPVLGLLYQALSR
ncbi:MAG: hypothetical protein OXH92_04860 [Bryobacterales bacterium]|nr:hypothetical protein [Bryobacterales bacterium]